ncbi:hypothetical protein C0V97_03920 [Asaia sp. W19]|uniref:hypothetical protein n=1 Tax=unclassified Asaia TaxID=2685023 RepID=UPI000F8DC250|nr:hypothetical protein [Asaia sp. W19]RUT26835.1 hypothetical protein C0V97_03920 [Asaia sp. W19]
MAFPVIPLPSVWDVPVMAGVPALLGQSIGNGVSASVSNLLGQEVANWQITSAAAQWGVFLNGTQILTSAHVLGIEHEVAYQVPSGPTENGGFVSYNKVKMPYVSRILLVCDGSESGTTISAGLTQVLGAITGSGPAFVRKSFFDTLEQIVADTNLYEIHIPERSYMSANIVGYRFRRTEREGITMPVAEIMLQEIRSGATQGYKNTSAQSVSAAVPVQSGQVQLQSLPSGAPDLAGIMDRISGL